MTKRARASPDGPAGDSRNDELRAPDQAPGPVAVSPDDARQRLEDFMETSSEWLWEMGPDLRFTAMSERWETATGMPVTSVIGKSRRELAGEAGLSLEMEMHLAWLEQHKPFRDFQYAWMLPDGRELHIATSGKPVFDQNGDFIGYRGTGRDVTEELDVRKRLVALKRRVTVADKAKSDAMTSLKEAYALLEDQNEQLLEAQEEIRHRALHDPLTGVGNRRFLDEQLAENAQSVTSDDEWLGVLHIDLDRFKQINDTLGHAAGDYVLCHVANVLEELVPDSDFVARVGGDEFVVVSNGEGDDSRLEELAQSLIDALSQPVSFEGKDCWFGASVGIATMRGENVTTQTLLVNADIALYRAKNQGRGCYEYFSAEVQEEIVGHKALADALRSGLSRNEIVAWYQPQISARTFEVIGVEALARWMHPDGRTLAPPQFMEVAEDLNVVPQIDRMILEQSVAALDDWDAMGVRVDKASVNVSSRRLTDPELVPSLRGMALPPGRMVFELLESVFLDEIDETLAWNLDMMREMGIQIALDDFGSGHASLISLVKLGPDSIKIDRQLVATIETDLVRRDLVRSIVDIGRSLNVMIVAEGVETIDQARLLRDMGCDYLQGYFISAPIEQSAVAAFVQAWNAKLPLQYPEIAGAARAG